MDVGDAVRSVAGGTEVDLMVSPKAGRSSIEGVDEWRKRLVVKVRSPPAKGKANKEICELLSNRLGAKVSVTRGHTNRHKTVLIEDDAGRVIARLQEAIA